MSKIDDHRRRVLEARAGKKKKNEPAPNPETGEKKNDEEKDK